MSQDSSSISTIWHLICSEAEKSERAWLNSLVAVELDQKNNILYLQAPNEFARKRVDTRLKSWIQAQIMNRFGKNLDIIVEINNQLESAIDREPVTIHRFKIDPNAEASYADLADLDAHTISKREQKPEAIGNFNPKFTFDSFVAGPSNNFAYSAALRVAEDPSAVFNPLMIYGGSGLGKTHLLHAIGHYINQYHPDLVVRYVSTEEMTNEFLNAIDQSSKDKSLREKFRRAYRSVDVLLVDDIQFLENKTQTQEEFFHTFNALHLANKQIVLTSDRKPSTLELLEDRLRSRFEMGLTTDVQLPDLETRMMILKRKAQAEGIELNNEILEYIASGNFTNIRELEGSLIRVSAYASLNRTEIDIHTAKAALKDYQNDQNTVIDPREIVRLTAEFYGITFEQITGSSRTATIAMARQVAMYLCREMTETSFPKIGHIFNRDHTTVIHGEKRVRKLISSDRLAFDQIVQLTNRIREEYR